MNENLLNTIFNGAIPPGVASGMIEPLSFEELFNFPEIDEPVLAAVLIGKLIVAGDVTALTKALETKPLTKRQVGVLMHLLNMLHYSQFLLVYPQKAALIFIAVSRAIHNYFNGTAATPFIAELAKSMAGLL